MFDTVSGIATGDINVHILDSLSVPDNADYEIIFKKPGSQVVYDVKSLSLVSRSSHHGIRYLSRYRRRTS